MIGSLAPHPSEVIVEEMTARSWSAEDLAVRMSDGTDEDYGICRLALDFYDEIGPDNTCMRLGAETAAKLGKAFDVSPQFFINLESAWLASRSAGMGKGETT